MNIVTNGVSGGHYTTYEWEALCQSFIGLIRHENASHCALILANEVYKEEED